MNDYFTSQRDALGNSFTQAIQEMMVMYADSKIDGDGKVEAKMEEIKSIIAQTARLRDDIKREISETDKSITRSSERANMNDEMKDKLEKANATNMVYTADQQMNDAKSLYDHHRILLLIKVGIVLLILVKGNEIFESYKLVFVGASLACIFVYMMFVLFFK